MIRDFRAAWLDQNNPAIWTGLGGGGYAVQSDTGRTVTPESALTLDSVFACIRNISDDVAKLPMFVLKNINDEGDKARVRNHPVAKLIHTRPHPASGPMNFMQTLVHYKLGWGDGYAGIVRKNGVPVRLDLIHPARIENRTLARSGEMVYSVRVALAEGGSEVIQIAGRDMIHLHGLGVDGRSGYAIPKLATNSIAIGLDAVKSTARFYKQGATLAGTLESEQALQPEEIENISNLWQQKWASSHNAYKTAILPKGLKYKAIDLDPEKAQFLDARRQSSVEMARWFRVGLHKIQADEGGVSFLNSSEVNREYARDCIHPIVTINDQEFSFKLLTEAERDAGLYIATNMNALLRASPVERANINRTYFGIGVRSINAINRLEDENGIGPDGDERFVPLNMQTVKQAVVAARAGNPASQPDSGENMGGPNPPRGPADPNQAHEQALRQALRQGLRVGLEELVRQELAREANHLERKAGQPAAEFLAEADRFYAAQAERWSTKLAPYLAALCEPPDKTTAAVTGLVDDNRAEALARAGNPDALRALARDLRGDRVYLTADEIEEALS